MAVLALAVGIGSASAIFTVVQAVLLKPLPYSDGERWVALFGGNSLENNDQHISALSYTDLIGYQQRTRSFDVFGWYGISGDFNLLSKAAPAQHVDGDEVSPSLIDNLGVNPIRGRLFQDADSANVVLLSQRLWARLGSDPDIVGKPIQLSGSSYTVVGVMPSWFRFPIIGVSMTRRTERCLDSGEETEKCVSGQRRWRVCRLCPPEARGQRGPGKSGRQAGGFGSRPRTSS